ncbi:MAG TPA: PLDc N-terminal domain-containing protein [Burkholderiales bacterium]|nr:PLDc N-terminal domain-containing protein [Burkholderiales bacterium]
MQPALDIGEQRGMGVYSLWSLLVLAADVWAILNVAQSPVSNEKKLLWILVVLLLPLLGAILWYFLGPRGGKA